VFYADTGEKKGEVPSPFQMPTYRSIQVSVLDTNGDGVPDEVVVSAKKGRKTVTAVFPG
jgi:hypothetical protein